MSMTKMFMTMRDIRSFISRDQIRRERAAKVADMMLGRHDPPPGQGGSYAAMSSGMYPPAPGHLIGSAAIGYPRSGAGSRLVPLAVIKKITLPLLLLITISGSWPQSCFWNGYAYTCIGTGFGRSIDPYPYSGSRYRWHQDHYQREEQYRPSDGDNTGGRDESGDERYQRDR